MTYDNQPCRYAPRCSVHPHTPPVPAPPRDPRSTLSDSDRINLYEDWLCGHTWAELAEEYGVSNWTISRVVRMMRSS